MTTNKNKEIEKLNKTLDDKKISVGFFYPTLFGNGIARFMIVTGEYFIKKGYDVYFFTKQPYRKDFKYNKKIKRFYSFNNFTLVRETCKSIKLDFLIINNVFDPGIIKFFKFPGIKIIGIFHGIFMSGMFNNSTKSYRNWKNTELFDAYIHLGIDDYYFFKNLGFKRNIFIPNLYTFDPSKSRNSNLTNNNIMMLGRLNDINKGLIYAIQAMNIIVKEVPDAKLNLISSDGRMEKFKNLTKELNLTNNIFFFPYTSNISEYFLNSSIFFFTSLTEAFPMALNEAKAHSLPCVTFDISYSVPFQNGVIKVKMFDYKALATEAIKLLKDYNYRKKMGKWAKLSLNKFNNEDTTNTWDRLFKSLKKGEDEFKNLREEIEKKYYNETIAKEHLERQFNYLKMYNKFFRCHSLQNFTNIDYINNIEVCKNVTL